MLRTRPYIRLSAVLLTASLLLLGTLSACDSALLMGPVDTADGRGGEAATDETADADGSAGYDASAGHPIPGRGDGSGADGIALSPAWDPDPGSSDGGDSAAPLPTPISGVGTVTVVPSDPPIDVPPVEVPPIDEPIVDPELPPVPLPDPEPDPEPDPDIEPGGEQAGTLTAGTFDDNLNYDASMAFLLDAAQAAPSYELDGITRGRRIVIRVQDKDEEPIGDARVVVEVPEEVGQQSQAVLDMTTGSDGCVLYHTGIDGGTDAESYVVTVSPPDGSAPVEAIGDPAEPVWTIALPDTESVLPSQLDLAFVIDATGSMSDELEYIKTEIRGIVDEVRHEFPNVDIRFALIVYRDAGDRYLTRVFDFTNDLTQHQSDLADQFAAGGGDLPESMHLALEDAITLDWRETGTARVMFLIADAPPHTYEAAQALEGVLSLRETGVAIYPVAASGVELEAEMVMRTAALLTLGQYVFLTDDSGVGNTHAEPRIPCYHVEHLDRIMIRAIESELAGHAIHPDPLDAIRTVGQPVDGVCEDSTQQQQ